MDLIYFFKVLFRRKWTIIGLSFLAAIATFFLLLYKKPLYVSTAQYSTGYTTEKVRLVDGSAAIDILTSDVKFSNAIETFKSPKVINMIGYKLMLHDLENPEEAYTILSKNDQKSKIYKALNLEEGKNILRKKLVDNDLLQTKQPMEAVLIEFIKLYGYDYESIMDHLVVEREGRTDYLNTIYRSENPELSAIVVNGLGNEFINYYRNLSSQRTAENAEGIRKVMKQQQEKVDSIGKLLYDEKVKQGSIDPVSLSTSAMETVKELETQLASEKSKQNEHLNRKTYLEARLRELEGLSSGSSGGGSKAEVIALTNKKNRLVQELAAKGGKDAALEKEIEDVREEISRKSSSGGGSRNKNIDQEIRDLKFQISEENAMYNAANATIADYTSRIRKYTGLANNAQVGSDVTIEAIKTQLDMENIQLSNYMEKYSQAAGLVQDDPTANFIQTKVGQAPIDSESKKTLLSMILASAATFFLVSLIFIFLEIFDPTLKTPTTFKKQLKMNLISVLNHLPLKKRELSEILATEEFGKKEKPLFIYKNNIRKLRHEILNTGSQINLFTSTSAGTGKTTVIESLATALSMSGRKILLIDMNFYNNSLTEKYNAELKIDELLSGFNESLPLAQQKISSETSIPNVDIIGCKSGNTTPAELFDKFTLHKFLTALKTAYDFILIESADLNRFSDSKELSSLCDKIYVVFSSESTISHKDDDALKFIAGLGEKNGGAILNDVMTENLYF